MRKRIKGRSLSREKDQRNALRRTMLVSLINNKKIETTLAKAKELKPYAEKMITLAKKYSQKGQLEPAGYRLLKKELPVDSARGLANIAEFSKERNGGCVRILKQMPRKSDSAEMALVEWTDRGKMIEEEKKNTAKKSKTVESKPSKKKEPKPEEK